MEGLPLPIQQLGFIKRFEKFYNKNIIIKLHALVKSLQKRVDDLSYNAGVAKDYSREIHDDPDKKERIKELDQIIKTINDITKYDFSEIIDDENELKTALRLAKVKIAQVKIVKVKIVKEKSR